MTEQSVELFGILSITMMVVFYALEKRGRLFIALFAIACCAASFYAYLIGSIPFMIAEGIWALIAFKRWMTAV